MREAAQKLGYMPNAAARALKTRRSHNLGLITKLRLRNGFAHDYISKILGAFTEEAERCGYDVTLMSDQIHEKSMSYLEHSRYRSFDGVAIICGVYDIPMVRELFDSGIPCVTADSFGGQSATVTTDNEDAMRQLVEYVVGRGHRRLGYIQGDESPVTRVRRASFHRACQAHGIEVNDSDVRSAFYNDGETTVEALREIMAQPKPPTCVFFPDDLAYLSGLAGMEAMGLEVPRDVSAVGFDGISISQVIRPRLCTFRQDSTEIGISVMRMLREAIEAPKTYLPRQIVVPGELIPGETVARI